MSVKVSVIIPVFGSTPFLAACREAMTAQTFRDFEIIECAPPPDGPQNAGAARNKGLSQASGEWISFVDADDIPLPDLLAEAVATGEREWADIVVFGAQEYDNKTGWVTPLPLNLSAGLGDDVRFTSFGNCVWNKLFRASYLSENGIRFQEITNSNDIAFVVEALARTERLAIMDKALYRYRINAGGLQGAKSTMPGLWRLALGDVRSRLEAVGLLSRFGKAMERLERQVSGDNLSGGRFSPCRICHSIRRRGLISFLKHALGRLVECPARSPVKGSQRKVAYLIDKESLGGGCEYIRRKSGVRRAVNDEWRIFYSDRGECRAQTLDEWGADEIVVNHLKALLQLLGRPWRRPKGRVRFVVHGIHLRKYQWMLRESGTKSLAALPRRIALKACFQARRVLETWLYRRCDEIVALTESDRMEILRLYGQQLHVVVEPNTTEGWGPDLMTELPGLWTSLGQTHFHYVCIGRFNYQKGQDRWIRHLAACRLPSDPHAEPSDLRTLFIGDGETLESCRKLAADLGVEDLCMFVGAVPEADRYLKCSEVVVSPSRWEGMPYLLMKARVLGCRILATDCPGNRDVLAGYEKWERLEL